MKKATLVKIQTVVLHVHNIKVLYVMRSFFQHPLSLFSGFYGRNTATSKRQIIVLCLLVFLIMPCGASAEPLWTWVSGSNSTNQASVYGTKGVPASGNIPGARFSVSQTDAIGNLWLFGGSGYAASGSVGSLNDLWKFDGTNWTWVSGSNATNQYGVSILFGT